MYLSASLTDVYTGIVQTCSRYSIVLVPMKVPSCLFPVNCLPPSSDVLTFSSQIAVSSGVYFIVRDLKITSSFVPKD